MTDEEEEYITLDEAASLVGIKKVSLYFYIRELGVETHKFPHNKHKYILRRDVERIRDTRKAPWKLGSGKSLPGDEAA